MNPRDCFTKLNLDFSDADIDNVELTFGHSYVYKDRKVVLIHHPETAFVNHIKSKLPEEFRSWIRSVRVTYLKDPIPYHRDHGGFVCINYYVVTKNARTIYYTEKPDAEPFYAEGQATANLYNPEDLIEECSFVAKPNDCYLLNIGEIHHVDICGEEAVRKLIQLTFNPDVTYNMVVDQLTELNLIEKIK
jgi:hypothetical protein